MRSDLYWVPGPWRGKLALAARPRGGDWLPDELASWKSAGIDIVLSLLTPEEQRDLDLVKEATESQKQGLVFTSFPILDREVPASEAKFNEALRGTNERLSRGENLVIHCRQGIGRTGLFAACLLMQTGMSSSAAIDMVSAARGVPIPETSDQRDWIERHAPAVTK
jgi:protein-tyrosine phosphatase